MQTDSFPTVLDSSMLAAFKSCPQLFYKIYVQNWKPKEGPNVHLHAGGAFAHGLEAVRRAYYEQGLEGQDAIAEGMKSLLTFYGDFTCPEDSAKSAARMAGALEYYFHMWPLSHTSGYPILMHNKRRAIEVNFAHPLPISNPETGELLMYAGRSDMICQYAGDNYIEDDKTTSRLGPSWTQQWDLRGQFLGYTWGFRTMGFRVAGVLVRGISILKTKYEKEEAIVGFADWEIDRWYLELLEWIEDMVLCFRRGRWKYNLDHSCAEYGGCGFKTVCKSQNEDSILPMYFERRHWDPITRIETKL